jgi:hypothetical protein
MERQKRYAPNAERKRKAPPIPESFLNEIEGLVSNKSLYQFAIGDKFLEGWDEMGTAYADYFKNERKAHRWFLESVAASSGIDPSTLRHHYRVAKHVPPDMRGGENEAFSYSHWKAMLAGDNDPEENLKENLEWAHKKLAEKGHPPSTRDIQEHVKHNGHKAVWEKRAERMLSMLGAMIDDDGAPDWLRNACKQLVEMVEERMK